MYTYHTRTARCIGSVPPQKADGFRQAASLHAHTEVDDASATSLGIIYLEVLLRVHLEARMRFLPKR